MALKETQEGLFVMKWKNFITMMISVIVGTNTVTSLIFKQDMSIEQITYNKERTDRKIKNERERNAFILKINNLEEKVRERDKTIKECKK